MYTTVRLCLDFRRYCRRSPMMLYCGMDEKLQHVRDALQFLKLFEFIEIFEFLLNNSTIM